MLRGNEFLEFDDWNWLREMAISAMSESMSYDPEVIEDQLGLTDFDRFASSRVDPNTIVGEEFIGGQEFTHPRLVLARDEHWDIAGYGLAYLNVSGSERARRVKRALVRPNYLYVREVFVDPELSGRGIGGTVLGELAKSTFPFRKVSTYIWPDLVPGMQEMLETIGFYETGGSTVPQFWDTYQARMEHPSADHLAHVLSTRRLQG